jgi:hypothetical protein
VAWLTCTKHFISRRLWFSRPSLILINLISSYIRKRFPLYQIQCRDPVVTLFCNYFNASTLHFLLFCYNQQIHNLTKVSFYIIYTPICFDISLSSSGIFTHFTSRRLWFLRPSLILIGPISSYVQQRFSLYHTQCRAQIVTLFCNYFNASTVHFLLFLLQSKNTQLILQQYISQEYLFI